MVTAARAKKMGKMDPILDMVTFQRLWLCSLNVFFSQQLALFGEPLLSGSSSSSMAAVATEAVPAAATLPPLATLWPGKLWPAAFFQTWPNLEVATIESYQACLVESTKMPDLKVKVTGT